MTEDEATTRWCPFARLLAHTYSQDGQGRSYEGGYSYNRSPDPDEVAAPYMPHGSYCIASACMAWRTTQVGRVLPGDEYKTYRNEGYCGLAGAAS